MTGSAEPNGAPAALTALPGQSEFGDAQMAVLALRAVNPKFVTLAGWETLCCACREAGVPYDVFYAWCAGIPDDVIAKWAQSEFVNPHFMDKGRMRGDYDPHIDIADAWDSITGEPVEKLFEMADKAGPWPGHWAPDRGLGVVLEMAYQYEPNGHWYLSDKPQLPLDKIGELPEGTRVRVGGAYMGNALVLPVRDYEGELVNLKLIRQTSIADLESGVIKSNAVSLLGSGPGGWFTLREPAADGAIYVCETLESAWACWRTTGAACVVSGDSFETKDSDIVWELRQQYPTSPLVLVACPRTVEYALDMTDGVPLTAVVPFHGEAQDVSAYEMLKRNGREVLAKQLAQAVPAPDTGPRFALLTSGDVAATPASAWALGGVFPAAGVAAAFGPSGVGKSFWVLDVVAAISEGRDYCGHQTTPMPVVYCVLEGQSGFNQRVQAWEQRQGRRLPQSVHLMLNAFNITNPKDVEELAGVAPKGCILVIDTLNAAAAGVDENGSSGMGQILAGAKQLQRLTGGLVLLVHHAGKNERAGLRGHSSLIAALDCAVAITAKGGRRTWSTDQRTGGKAKDGASVTHQFELEVVHLVTGETSCVVSSETDAPGDAQLPLRLRVALGAFEGSPDTGPKRLHVDEWRTAYYATATGTTDAKRKAFQRVRTELVAGGHLTQDGDHYSLTPAKAQPGEI